jgi:hypothetical protein
MKRVMVLFSVGTVLLTPVAAFCSHIFTWNLNLLLLIWTLSSQGIDPGGFFGV